MSWWKLFPNFLKNVRLQYKKQTFNWSVLRYFYPYKCKHSSFELHLICTFRIWVNKMKILCNWNTLMYRPLQSGRWSIIIWFCIRHDRSGTSFTDGHGTHATSRVGMFKPRLKNSAIVSSSKSKQKQIWSIIFLKYHKSLCFVHIILHFRFRIVPWMY